MKPKTTWIVIADSQRAFVLKRDKPKGELTVVQSANWKAEAAAEIADKQGRSFATKGASRSAMEPHINSQPKESIFAKVVATDLATAQQAGRFDQLVLCAGPKMLSELADAAEPLLGRYLRGQLQKNLVNAPITEIKRHLDDLMLH